MNSVDLASSFVFGAAAFATEASGFFNIPYSKFSKGGVAPRWGFFTLYFVPLVAHLAAWLAYGGPVSFFHLLLLGMYMSHFTKRCLECLYLHEYSTKISPISVVAIAVAYTIPTLLAAKVHNGTMSIKDATQIPVSRLFLGLAIFIIGEVGNFYHHMLLSNLRREKGTKQYLIPTGGLFELVVCPHYFFEIIAWLGIAIASGFLEQYSVLIVCVFYLAGRSYRTKEWYISKFDDFPRGRKRLVPFVY